MGQSDPVRAQLSTLSAVVRKKPSRATPWDRSVILSFPFERALLPLVDESHHEDAEEDEHGDEAEPADVLQHDRPREEERDLEVEEDEEDGHQVVAHVEL